MSPPAEEVFTGARRKKSARTYGDWRVDVLNVAFFDEKILGAFAQRLDIGFGERLAVAQLLNPPVQVRANRHQGEPMTLTIDRRRSQIPASKTVRQLYDNVHGVDTCEPLSDARNDPTTQRCR